MFVQRELLERFGRHQVLAQSWVQVCCLRKRLWFVEEREPRLRRGQRWVEVPGPIVQENQYG